ncbi:MULTISPECIES: hypothetical protein [Amycolatopsis]|uniref:Uncharacterized protein n=1 Tax=Amycolatopsis dongchuanensis TaxID=1070866 RepID=A0ABP9Q3V2_9PSEU
MDIAALIISGLSLVVAGIGTYWSNRRSKEALAGSRRAAADARWSARQEAVQRLTCPSTRNPDWRTSFAQHGVV